jgi:hypothetical protein
MCRTNHVREHRSQPRSAGEDVAVGRQCAAIGEPHGPGDAGDDRARLGGGAHEPAALALHLLADRPAGLACEQVAGLALKVDRANALEADLGKAALGVVERQLLHGQPKLVCQRQRLPGVGVVAAKHPQAAGSAIELDAARLLELAPQRERAGDPLDVDAIGAVQAADDAGLAAGAGAGAPGSPGVDERDLRAPAHQMQGGPSAEAAGADDDDVRAGSAGG